ncbi:MAG: YesL family protein [Lachnospiraceae bacterium]|nr:YesL family protein [Lachnospiraceae bacterium]
MKGLFSLDNPLVQFLNDLTDVVVLNLICLLCCIPIVTIGASITALHYVTLRMTRDEEGYIIKDFFRAFKQNFKQATIIWLIFLAISFLFFLDIRIFNLVDFPRLVIAIVYALYFFVCLTAMYVFPLLSRFNNTILNTIKNAFLMSIIHLLRTILLAIIYILPVFVVPLHGTLVGVWILLGISGPAYLASFIWKGIFKRYEPREEGGEEEECAERE